MLLALDSATDAVSVALHDGERVVATATVDAARRHAEVLVPLIDEVLAQAGAAPRELSAIGVGVGPGGFTGLRVGLVTARSLAYALGIECHGVLSLDAVAFAALAAGDVGIDQPFGVALDARRREVFWARYVGGVRDGNAQAGRPGEVAANALKGLTVVGDAADLYPEDFVRWVRSSPSAAAMATIVQERPIGFAVLEPEPVYVRRPDAAEPGERKQVTPTGAA